jgi:hypothetical protein
MTPRHHPSKSFAFHQIFIRWGLCCCTLSLGQAQPPDSYWDYHPLRLEGQTLHIGQADVEHGHLAYRTNELASSILLPLSTKTYLFPKLSWRYFTLDWNQNPKFRSTHFNALNLACTLYTTALQDWRWIAKLDYQSDLEHLDQLQEYGLWTALLWGSYTFKPSWRYHVGTLAYTGLESTTLYPLLGLDYTLCSWNFSFIFPIEYKIQYQWTYHFATALQGRPLKERFRVGSRETQPKSVFNYTSVGAELLFSYTMEKQLTLEAFAGYSFGGTLYIKDRFGNDPIYVSVRTAPYVGGRLDYGF